MKPVFLVTGGAGFIGVNFVKMLLARDKGRVVVLDALTYAGNLESLKEELESGAIEFVQGNIADSELVAGLLERYRPDYIINFAAESHVDRSVDDPKPFIDTNVCGTQNMLECARQYIRKGGELKKFVQISTDEVYGDLEIDFEEPVEDAQASRLLGRSVKLFGRETFSEATPIKPSSPYSASKASADMIAMSYHRSFGLPVLITRCSNNYGAYQFPEKLIPLMVNNLLEGKKLPVYGRGTNVRDWIHVSDHCAGVLMAAEKGLPGKVYNLGGYSEQRNIDLVHTLISEVYKRLGRPAPDPAELISYVGDRPGHDLRYAIDASHSIAELGWRPEVPFEQGIADTVGWYLDNRPWVERIVAGDYRDYYRNMYENR